MKKDLLPLMAILFVFAIAEWLLPVPPGIGFAAGLAWVLRRHFHYSFVPWVYGPVLFVLLHLSVYVAAFSAEGQATHSTLQKSAMADWQTYLLVASPVGALLMYGLTLMTIRIDRYPGCLPALLTMVIALAGAILLILLMPTPTTEGYLVRFAPFMGLLWQLPMALWLVLFAQKATHHA